MTTGHDHQNAQAHGGGHNRGGHGHGHGAYDASFLIRSDAFYGPVYRQIVDWLSVTPGTVALEAGSGAGGFTELLAEAVGEQGTVSALDMTPELLQTAREHLQERPVVVRAGLWIPA